MHVEEKWLDPWRGRGRGRRRAAME